MGLAIVLGFSTSGRACDAPDPLVPVEHAALGRFQEG